MKIATITAVYNEEDLLPQYIDHYRREGVDTVFLLDSGSTDKTLEIAQASPLVEVSGFSVPGVGFDGPKHHAIMQKMTECIGRFDYVLLVDADEFVVAENRDPIREVLVGIPGGTDLCTTTGFSMSQGKDELEYDPSVPLTDQRKWGVFDRLMSKPIVVNPAAYPVYCMGCHSVGGIPRSRTLYGKFKLLHYPAPSEAIFLKRRLQKEPRVHDPKARKDEAHFKRLYSELRGSPDLSQVI